jgi:hypothetical protein
MDIKEGFFLYNFVVYQFLVWLCYMWMTGKMTVVELAQNVANVF